MKEPDFKSFNKVVGFCGFDLNKCDLSLVSDDKDPMQVCLKIESPGNLTHYAKLDRENSYTIHKENQ